MKRPTNSDTIWTAYTKEFQLEVWIGLLVMIIIMVFCLYCSIHILHLQPPLSISEAAFTTIGLMCGQGTSYEFSHGVQRTVVMTTLVFYVVLLAHYTSDLVSGLSMGPALPSISTLEDVARDPDLKVGYLRGTSVNYYLRSTYENIWLDIQKRNYSDVVSSYEEGVQKVLGGEFLFILPRIVYHYSFAKDCKLLTLPSGYFQTQYSLTLTKRSPLKPIFNKLLLNMRSAGLVEKWKRDMRPESPDCNVFATSVIEMPTLTVPFLILAVAMVISLLILIAELCKTRNKES